MTTINLKAMIQEWNKLDSLYYQWDGICRRDWLKKLYNQANDLYRQIGLRALECTMEELTDLTKSEFEFIYEAACRARRNV